MHFDEDEVWEQDGGSATAVSLTLIAAHELGHALGLLHDSSPGGPHIMRPAFGLGDTMQGPSPSDTANIQSGYAAGGGAVITLEQSGIWVDGAYGGAERGTPENPFDTIVEGADGVPQSTTSVAVHIQAGQYGEALTLTQPMILVAENGTVTIAP